MDMLANRRAAAVGASVLRAAPAAPPPCGGCFGTQCGTSFGADVCDELASSPTVDGATSSGACRRAPPLAGARRNAGMHCTSRRGASIARMRMASLNRLQRSGPDCRPRHGRGAGGRGRAALPQLRPAGAVAPHRRVPAQRSAAEGVATGWRVARRRGRSLPAGASFALAERLRSAGPPTAAPLASGPLWWHAGVEGLDDTVLARPESGGGFGAHIDPRPSEDGAVQPPRLPGPGTACSTACASSPPAFADPSIVAAYLLANEAAVLSGGSGAADGGLDGVIGMQVDDSRNQDGNCTSPPASGAPLTGSGGGLAAAASEVGGSAVEAAPRGPRRLLALSSHVFAGTVALTVDRDIRRTGWQEAGGEAAPPAPSAAEIAEGRQWLRSQFGPGSPWRAWASKERRRRCIS
ncbi:unnamed protein product [Prorocentrum cordatum]|uniref:Uncharacterized protein n=1 Tax=Prorocentrum cordatum TaxID=2364126 RepID=A0ABN9UFW4_9DINO|nr:unnamed protein product [Polarella glacialis]